MKAQDEPRPSAVYGSRLRDIRATRKLTQAQLAARVTDAGRPMNQAAITRIERGERGLSLDEALALAWVLQAAPAHLLSPPDDQLVWLTGKIGLGGAELRNWLLFGDPLLLSPEGRCAKKRIGFAFEVEALAQALIDAKRGDDSAGRAEAVQALADAIDRHRLAINGIEERTPNERPCP